ncbi:MAG: GlxA family transcriptional regulator [Gammaproteobacteria bacterium]|nr:GlxA family transcriptional regulator [Gammaproteobacteria bacterium]MCY4219744.1 GlxA family transcriptional regulator [Gammaproteobacteria bacterium]MCY4273882.1 GlxA family transcriptional regulator [Gammaproteobacteria bacterium]
MQDSRLKKRTARYGFLLLPGFSITPFAAALDPLRMANRLSKEDLYKWVLLGESKHPVISSSGLKLKVTALKHSGQLDTVFVCGGVHIENCVSKTVRDWLRIQAKRHVKIGALCTGSYILAEAGLLGGYRCTIHWENMASLMEKFPELIVSPVLFKVDRNRYTCAGGIASMDMMIHLIALHHGTTLANEIAEEFMLERVRDQNDRQPSSLRILLGGRQPKLAEAVIYMEANKEDLLELGEIAGHIGISRRQLERLFRKYLNCSPVEYYKRLRLIQARQLLQQTSMSISEVSITCGFNSSNYFSKCYREHFNYPPSSERRPNLG